VTRRTLPLDLLAAGAYCVLGLVWIASMPELARLDRDEGFNLMKSDLVSAGYRLYAQIWSDQPALFTHMLAWWQQLFGDSDAAARVLVLLMTSVGLASVGRLATWSADGRSGAGLLAVLLLIGGRSYPKLSMAVMIGLPAISTALASVVLWRFATTQRHGWALAVPAGALFACSMQIKLFTFMMIPFALTTFFVAARQRSLSVRHCLAHVALWTLALASVTWLIGPWREPAWKQQLVTTHLKTGLSTDDTQADALRSIVMRFLEDAPLMLATFVAIAVMGHAGFRRCAPQLVWMGCSVAVLSQANPLWGHHRVMFSIPASMIAGICLHQVIVSRGGVRKVLRGDWSARCALVAAGLALGNGAAQVGVSAFTLGRGDDTHDALVVQRLREINARGNVRWIISDDPHIVRAAGLLVPPETAVLSLKRLQRDLTEERFAEIIASYRPPAILLARHTYRDAFVARITEGFQETLSRKKGRIRLFERSDATTR
jgi:hypothetical protein